jgi:hypothetical protein
MNTQKYKCIAQPKHEGMNFTIGKEYEFTFANYPKTFDDLKELCSFSTTRFNECFQKVEATTTQPMKYKVTITTQDITGYEDVEVYENLTLGELLNMVELHKDKKISTEPMPEKKKVTVWFYVVHVEGVVKYSMSRIDKDQLKDFHKAEIKNGRKVSEIKSVEVEI